MYFHRLSKYSSAPPTHSGPPQWWVWQQTKPEPEKKALCWLSGPVKSPLSRALGGQILKMEAWTLSQANPDWSYPPLTLPPLHHYLASHIYLSVKNPQSHCLIFLTSHVPCILSSLASVSLLSLEIPTLWIINSLLVKSKLQCLPYFGLLAVHEIFNCSSSLYDVMLSRFSWALCQHWSSCFFLLSALTCSGCHPLPTVIPTPTLSQWSDSLRVWSMIYMPITPAQTSPLWFIFPGGLVTT